jgi:hypothetical protein
MRRECAREGCHHYALHVVEVVSKGISLDVCHNDMVWAESYIRNRVPRWARLTVRTSSAVVVGDIRDWRTRSLTAYDVLRQIGA